jgi:putative membrane protein
LLSRFHNLTLAFLAGLITGSLQKIWPWKQVIETQIIRGKEHVIWGHPILPATIDQEFYLAVLMAILGFVMVWMIERVSYVRH